ncbi:MAG: M14 family zinc carboxypeptidase [Gemmatimonadota bacterium]|jgi:hypothetical protein
MRASPASRRAARPEPVRPNGTLFSSRIVHAFLALALLLAAATPALAQQANDREYTDLIRQYTTEPFFLTPLVDHLPASSTVPTPLEFLGNAIGAPEVLHYPAEIYAYMRAVDAASDRVKVFTVGTTEEGREQLLVVVADEATMARIDDYKAMTNRLADPRMTSPAEAERLVETAKPMYWATGAIHSTETGSPEMLMELVYRLAVEESPHIRAIRDNIIVMVTPVTEVDGRAKVVDLALARRKDPNAPNTPSRPIYWGAYVAHDNNRDGIGMSLKLQQNTVKTFLEWKPTVMHDLHESASYLYTSTGRGPYNAWIDPIVVDEWNRLAHKEVQDMTAWGVPGIYTHDYYDGWAPNYMFWIANMRNSIGRFYETQGSGDGSYSIVRGNVDRQWSRMNTPLPEVVWGIRNNVNLQQSAILIAMKEVADNRQEFLRDFYRKSQRSVAKATAEGPAAWVFPAADPRPGQQARLLDLMQMQGVEVHRADRAIQVGDQSFAAGSYVIRMDQPYSRAADMLLDKQYYNPNDPSPYDDTGWTLGPLFNATTVRVEDPAILQSAMTLAEAPVRAPGGVEGSGNAAAYLVDFNADNKLTAFRYRHRNLRIGAAERSFESGGRRYGAGTFIIRADGNGGSLRQTLEQAGREFGFTAVGVATVPAVDTHPVTAPRVALMHTWQSTQQEGWVRIGLDEYGIPYDYISVQDVRDNPRLQDKYDVILFGPSSNDPLSTLRGVTGDQPVPWKATDLTPNIGRQASADDIRGGLELTGVINIDNFVKAGGTFITITNSSTLPIQFGMADGVSVRETQNLWAPGGVFRTRIADRNSPLSYGYGDELGVYFNRGPVLAAGGGGFGGRGGRGGFAGAGRGAADDGSTTARRTSRGGIDDQDIVQGRARDLGQAGVERFRQENPGGAAGGRGGRGGGASTSNIRTIFRFSPDVRTLLISGGLTDGAELANAPALVDVSSGSGHILLFSFNPFWRGETLGSYGLVFNALLNHGSLSAGRGMADDR